MIFPKMYEIATKDVVKVDSKISLKDTIQILKNSHHRSIIVTKGKDYYLFSAINLIQMKLNENNLDIELGDISLPIIPQMHKDLSVIDAMELVNSGIRLICIVEDDKSLFGIVTNSDIISSIDPETLMDTVKIKDYCKKQLIVFIDKNQTLFEAVSRMDNDETDCVIVTDNNIPKGILTSKDTISIISNNISLKEKIDSFYSYPLQTIPENFTIKEAVDYVNTKHFKRIVAVDGDGNITGIISQQNLISYSYSHWAAMMKNYHDELLNLNKQLREKSDKLEQMVIADRKKELQLIEQQKELQTIFDTTKDGIAVLDMDTRFKKVNKAYCEITGLSEEELLSTSCFALTYPEDIPNTQAQMKILLEQGFVDSYEKRCFLKGKILSVNISVNLLPDGNHMLLSMKDITKFKTFEAQSKLASMGEMIGNIAHQWRQPLSVIAATSSGISLREEMGILDKNALLEGMENITNQAGYLSKTIDDFRNFIKDTHEQEKLSIKATLQKTISIVSPAMKSHNIRLIVYIVDDIEIIGYENELIQSFINIINNSRDAIEENVESDEDKLIFITTVASQEGLNVIIKDSGGGVPQNVIEKIFEPYFTTKHQSVGTGIGLSMTYKILTEHHNGTIDVHNEKYEYNGKNYKGACFEIQFPFSFKK
jgi:PAS domain S-box-containing protein